MNTTRHLSLYVARLFSFVFIAFFTLMFTQSTYATDSVELYYDIDRSAVPDLTYNDLTLKIDADNITSAHVSTLNGTEIPHIYDATSGEVIFTTDVEQVKVVLNGVTDSNSVGQVSKAPLKEDKKWAWSVGLDDNTFLQESINLMNAKGWAGTLFMIGEAIEDTRDEDWITDVPGLHDALDNGWAVGNHTSSHECFGDIEYLQGILDGYHRLQEIVDDSSKPDYKIISFAAPCFNGDYHPYMLAMRDAGQTAVQFNESGNDYLLTIDADQNNYYSANGITASPFDFDSAIGRDYHLEYDAAHVITHLDWMAAQASPTQHFWYNTLSHGANEETIGQVVDYLYDTYGPDGTDEAWVAPSDMIYSYLLVRDNSVVTLSNGSPPPTNTPPTITQPADEADTEGDSVILPITASDANNDPLHFSATELPTGLAIDSNTGIIFGSLPAGSANIYNVTVTVNDGTDEATIDFVWTVNAPANQSPTVSPLGNQSHQEGETLSLSISATDPEGNSLSFSATGLPDGIEVYSSTGTISGTVKIGAALNTPYNVTVTANDHHGGTDSKSFTWSISPLPAGQGSNQLLREQWMGIPGETIEALTTNAAYPDSPAVQDHISSFDLPVDAAEAYGTRIRGYIHPPVTGQYRFWMAADDQGELWLSSDDEPTNSSLIASVQELTLPHEWDKEPTQESTLITLQAGTHYYIEALHKEDSGGDHLAVAWQMPGGTREVITGSYLSPYNPNTPPPVNRAPSMTNPNEQTNFTGDNVDLTVIASDPDGDLLTYNATGLPAGLSIDHAAGTISGTIVATATLSSPYSVTVTVDDANGGNDQESFSWIINEAPTAGNTGQILRERWDDIFGSSIADLIADATYPHEPTVEDYLTTFEIPEDVADLYGSRIRGYIHVPVTGEYRFWLASDNDGELWLSTDEEPDNASLIASVSGWTLPRDWDGTAVESAPVTLEAGKRYYVQALHKAEWGGDHLAVAWQIPGSTTQIIDGQYLSAYGENGTPASNHAPFLSSLDDQTNLTGASVSLQVTANDTDGDSLIYNATNLPDGVTIDSQSALISGILSHNSTGTHHVTISVDDGNGATDSQSFTWTVTAPPSGNENQNQNGVGTILRERWDDLFGGDVSDLTSDESYPNSPDVQDYLTGFEIPEDAADLYGTRLRGYIHAPVTGQYRFWLASDNGGELWLSTDEQASHASLITSVSGWTLPKDWNSPNPTAQSSVLITLQAGEKYYIEALHKAEWGGDHLAVAWEIPGSGPELIEGQHLSPYVINNPTINDPTQTK